MALTEIQLKNAKHGTKPYKLSDSGGLFALVHPNGSTYWRYKYRYNGMEKTLALGVYPEIKLAEARKRHLNARNQLSEGTDPSAAKAAAKRLGKLNSENSFEAIALEWIESRKNGWTPNYIEKQKRQLRRHIFPKLGSRPITDISAPELLSVLRQIEAKGTLETAHRAKQNCGQIFAYAIASGRAERNPAAEVTGALKTPKKKHNPHLEAQHLQDFLAKLEAYDGESQTKLAIKLMLLTALRTTELRGAKWTEIDFDKREWRIPVERMKMRKLHIVPLSTQAIAVLRDMQRITGNMAYVCSQRSNPRKFMSENTMLYALYRMGYHGRLTIHGMRGTISTILNESGFNRDWVERQLAHADRDKVRASYNHTDYMADRAKMMQWWGDYLVKAGMEESRAER